MGEDDQTVRGSQLAVIEKVCDNGWPGARERVIQMQLVDPEHQRQIGGENGTREIIDTPPADAEGRRLGKGC